MFIRTAGVLPAQQVVTVPVPAVPPRQWRWFQRPAWREESHQNFRENKTTPLPSAFLPFHLQEPHLAPPVDPVVPIALPPPIPTFVDLPVFKFPQSSSALTSACHFHFCALFRSFATTVRQPSL
ncbi:hypothetical protein VTJ04DRAFT_8835 [Mycothermus thermophilus]|uniref:uncharacterized protein n=1 Tax=Humicola insolens TaxID=85995 RepID=UPI003744696C